MWVPYTKAEFTAEKRGRFLNGCESFIMGKGVELPIDLLQVSNYLSEEVENVNYILNITGTYRRIKTKH